MSGQRVLIIEDESEIRQMLVFLLDQAGFTSVAVESVEEGLKVLDGPLPQIVLVDWMLPGKSGIDFVRSLRADELTKDLPVIMLTAKTEEDDKLKGLDTGADDYITKPFDIEELKLRVRTSINKHKRLNLTDPISGLPSSRLIEDQLRNLMRSEGWTYLQISIEHLSAFKDVYGFVASDEVLRFSALLLNEIDDNLGTFNDFIGHASSDTFVLITMANNVQPLVEQLRQRFKDEIVAHYNFMDREQGGVTMPDGSLAPLMHLSIGLVAQSMQQFSDIREITEMAAELRRLDQG